ncbi:monocarboxylate transporter 9-like isoform X2 [Homarus americanus]|nr:monocarboxylate transporter 9-like isoform X2 [Homarus americanus]
MLAPCFGILFAGLLGQTGTSSTEVAWIFNTFMLVWKLMVLVVGPMGEEVGIRKVAFTGTLLAAVAVMLCSLANSTVSLFFLFSIAGGIGGGLSVGACFPTLAKYFDRHRGLANAFLMAGISAGQFINAPLIRYLQDEYTYKGASLIVGAIILHACLGAALMQPVEWHMKRVRCTVPPEGAHPLLSQPSSSRGEGVGEQDSGVSLDSNQENAVSVDAATPRRPSDVHLINNSHPSLPSCKHSTLTLASMDSENLAAITSTDECIQEDEEAEKDCCVRAVWSLVVRVVTNSLCDLKILRSPRALIIALIGALTLNSHFNIIMLVPFAMKAAGHSLSAAAWCVSVSAVTNTISRILVSTLSDYSWFSIKYFYMSGIFVLFSATIVWSLILKGELVWLVVTMGVWGIGVGIIMGLHNIAMVEYLGLDNLRAMFGTNSAMVGIGFIIIGPLAGVIRDVSKSYAISLWFLAAIIFITFLLWVAMPAAVAYDRRREAELQSDKELQPALSG